MRRKHTHQSNFSTWKVSYTSEKHTATTLWNLPVIHLIYGCFFCSSSYNSLIHISLPEILDLKPKRQLQSYIWESIGFFQNSPNISQTSKIQSHFCIKAKQENKSDFFFKNPKWGLQSLCNLRKQRNCTWRHIVCIHRTVISQLWLSDLSAHCVGFLVAWTMVLQSPQTEFQRNDP